MAESLGGNGNLGPSLEPQAQFRKAQLPKAQLPKAQLPKAQSRNPVEPQGIALDDQMPRAMAHYLSIFRKLNRQRPNFPVPLQEYRAGLTWGW